MLDEIWLHGRQSDIYKLVSKPKEEVIDDNITLSRKFDLEIHCLRFIVASRKCSTKVLSKAVTKAFKLIFKQIQSCKFMKSHIFTMIAKIWVVENCKPVIDRLSKINTKLAHFSLNYHTKVLFVLIDFGLNGRSKKKTDFSLKNAFWSNKPKIKSFFSTISLKRTVQF